MSGKEALFEKVASLVSDGAEVDWREIEGLADSEEERRLLLRKLLTSF